MTALGASLGLLCAGGGVWLLRGAWRRRGDAARLMAGWALLAAGVVGWRLAGPAWDKATALAILAPGLVAVAVLVAGAEWPRRSAKPSRDRATAEVEPPSGSGPAWRMWTRIACMGPLALTAAVGCGALVAIRLPGDPADRLVAAGFVMPLVWAAAGVWATTDDRIGRVAGTLGVVAVLALGAARL